MPADRTAVHSPDVAQSGEALLLSSGLIDAKLFQQLLGCAERHFYTLKGAGRLPGHLQLGTRKGHRWRAEEVRAWLDSGMPPREEWERHPSAAQWHGRRR